jgi:hypothetical protein
MTSGLLSTLFALSEATNIPSRYPGPLRLRGKSAATWVPIYSLQKLML